MNIIHEKSFQDMSTVKERRTFGKKTIDAHA